MIRLDYVSHSILTTYLLKLTAWPLLIHNKARLCKPFNIMYANRMDKIDREYKF